MHVIILLVFLTLLKNETKEGMYKNKRRNEYRKMKLTL